MQCFVQSASHHKGETEDQHEELKTTSSPRLDDQQLIHIVNESGSCSNVTSS
jgi:hypothetical protein